MSISSGRHSSLPGEAQQRRQTSHGSSSLSRWAGILVNHSAGAIGSASQGASLARQNAVDGQAFNQAVQKLDEAVNNLPTVGVVRF